MAVPPIIHDVVVIFCLSTVVLLACTRLKIPAIIGFLATGALSGPHGLGIVNGLHEVEILAEVGVVLLMFGIGLEFSLEKLVLMKERVIIGGVLQTGLSIFIVCLLATCFGFSWAEACFFGFLVSLSSTAIVLKLLQDRAEIPTPHGQSVLGILIFQDIAVVPMMLLVPFLAGTEGQGSQNIFLYLGKSVMIVGGVFMLARWGVPHLLFQIAKARSNQLFLLSILSICLAVALLTSSLGLSLALGAFLAGLIIAESEYSHHAVGHIIPFQQIFTSFFFVSIGMLLDVGFVAAHPFEVAGLSIGTVVIKVFTGAIAVIALGYPLRTAILTGMALAQVGEFSFILSAVGATHHLLDADNSQRFLAMSLTTMAATPFLISSAQRFANWVQQLPLPLPNKTMNGGDETMEETPPLKDHIIIVGFGVCGRNLAHSAKLAGIPYIVLEMNPETVRTESKKGEPIFFGDATHEAILEHVNIKEARVIAIVTNDAVGSRRIVEVARQLSPRVHIITRTIYLREVEPILALGANEVVPEEFEASVEIFSRALRKYLIPQSEIEKFATEIRANIYEAVRPVSNKGATLSDLKAYLSHIEINTFRVSRGSSVVGKTLAECAIRNKYGVSVLVVRRGQQVMANPGPDTLIMEEDVVAVMGEPDNLVALAELFRPSLYA